MGYIKIRKLDFKRNISLTIKKGSSNNTKIIFSIRKYKYKPNYLVMCICYIYIVVYTLGYDGKNDRIIVRIYINIMMGNSNIPPTIIDS